MLNFLSLAIICIDLRLIAYGTKYCLNYVFKFNQRTIGEIIHEDIGDDGIALGLTENQLSRCVSHSSNSLEWGINYLEKNISKHPNNIIKVTK